MEKEQTNHVPNGNNNQTEQQTHSNNQAQPQQELGPRVKKKSWYNQGWLWLIVAVAGIAIIYMGFSGLTRETVNMNAYIQGQTTAIREQTGVLGSIKDSLNQITLAIKDAVIQIKDTIQQTLSS
jgi:hypothetical protein